jgi:hypothetical protein
MNRFIGLVLLMLVLQSSFRGFAQVDTVTHPPAKRTVPIKPHTKPKPIKKEWSIGIATQTNGWFLYTDIGTEKAKNIKVMDKFYNTTFFHFSFGEQKSPKEAKVTNSQIANYTNETPSAFIYGKVNNFYTLKAGVGYRKMIAGKPEQGNISIHWMSSGGLSMGLLKPYYINAFVNYDSTGAYTKRTIKYADPYKGIFLSNGIIGSAGFATGMKEIKFVPGVYFTTGLHLDFAMPRKTILAVETGISFEYFSQPIVLMANETAVPYFVNLYAGIQFGKRRR